MDAKDLHGAALLAKRNISALAQQANYYQAQVESQGNELRLLRQTVNTQAVDIAQLKSDLLQLRMSLVSRGPTHRE